MGIYKRGKRTVKKATTAKKGTKKTVNQLAKKVSNLTKTLKPEVKEAVLSNANTPAYVAQLVGNISGAYGVDISPAVTQSVANNGRVGSKLNMLRTRLALQVYHQSATNTPIRLRILIVRNKGLFTSAVNVLPNIFRYNPFLWLSGSLANIIDYNSDYDSDSKPNFEILLNKSVLVPMENYATGTYVKTININKYYRNPIPVWFDGQTTNVTHNQTFMFVLADAGNYSATVASTVTGSPMNVINSGLVLNYFVTQFYTDD